MSDILILPSMPFRSRSNCVSWWKQWCFAETTWHLDKKWSSATNWWSIWQIGSWETHIRSTLVIFVACPGMDLFYVWLFYSRLEHYLCKLDLFASTVQNCVVLFWSIIIPVRNWHHVAYTVHYWWSNSAVLSVQFLRENLFANLWAIA